MLINETTEGQFSTSTAVTLSRRNWFSDYLVQSGSYLPISVGLWGTVKEASLSWGDTVQLVSVQAYQGGLELRCFPIHDPEQQPRGLFREFRP